MEVFAAISSLISSSNLDVLIIIWEWAVVTMAKSDSLDLNYRYFGMF